MKRCEIVALLDLSDDFVVQYNRISKLLAAVYDTMADCRDLGKGGNNAAYRIRQCIQNEGYRNCMVRHIDILIQNRFTFRLMDQMAVDADTLTETLCDNFLGLHVDQLILK